MKGSPGDQGARSPKGRRSREEIRGATEHVRSRSASLLAPGNARAKCRVGRLPPQDVPAHRGRWRQVWTWWRGRGEPATPLRCLPVGARRPRSVPHGRHAGPEAPSQDTRSQDTETRGRQDVSPAVRGGVFRTREEAGNTQASSNCRMKEQNAA